MCIILAVGSIVTCTLNTSYCACMLKLKNMHKTPSLSRVIPFLPALMDWYHRNSFHGVPLVHSISALGTPYTILELSFRPIRENRAPQGLLSLKF